MTAGERFKEWISNTAAEFADRLGTFLGGVISGGSRKFTDELEPGIIDQMKPILTSIRDNPNTPQEYRDYIDKALQEGNIGEVLAGWILTVVGIIPQVMGLGAPLGRQMEYLQDKLLRSHLLDPQSVINAWRREPGEYEKYFEDLQYQGWSDERIEALKFVTQVYPPVADMVRFADFGSFDPEVISKWREFYDAPGWISDPMSLIGIMNEEGADWANKYWFSHWVQPGRYELAEMYRRGLMGTPRVGQDEVGGGAAEGEAEETVKLAYRTMGYSSFWQDRLLQLVREVPTRVDVRRWWDMRTIDEVELRSIYQRRGYFGTDLENYVVWTKVYVAFPDLLARWKNGWIQLEDVKSELVALGMPEARADELIETKIKVTEAERIVSERDLTKTDIIKGVKTERITRVEGVELLMDLGYDEDEAIFLLDINIPEDKMDTAVVNRELTKSDIKAGLREGIITESEAMSRLQELRYSARDAQYLLDIYKATISPPEEEAGRQASKADIVKAVKNGLITPEDGYLMLQEIGFTPEASEFILMVQAETTPFSPINFTEFKKLTSQYQKLTTPGVKTMPEELTKAADELVQITKDIESLEELIKQEKAKLVEEEGLPEEATAHLEELQVSLNRALSEKERLQQEYDRLVAEWRHGSAKL